VTSAKTPAKKTTARKPTAAKRTTATKKATAAKKAAPAKKRVVRERKLGAVVLSVVEAKPARRRKPIAKAVVAPVTPPPAVPSVQLAPSKAARPLVAKERARRKVTLPFRERLEAAMHRELKHKGPVCHPCRMNASRLAALATS